MFSFGKEKFDCAVPKRCDASSELDRTRNAHEVNFQGCHLQIAFVIVSFAFVNCVTKGARMSTVKSPRDGLLDRGAL